VDRLTFSHAIPDSVWGVVWGNYPKHHSFSHVWRILKSLKPEKQKNPKTSGFPRLFRAVFWWEIVDSNHRPLACQGRQAFFSQVVDYEINSLYKVGYAAFQNVPNLLTSAIWSQKVARKWPVKYPAEKLRCLG
jgi:hypothetical protein